MTPPANPANDPYMPQNMSDIFEVERAMEKHENETWESYMNRLVQINGTLNAFYNSDKMKKMKNYLKKAMK